MSLKDLFKSPENAGPKVVEVKRNKPKKKPAPREIVDFSFNEYRFGHFSDTGAFFKSVPKPLGLYGFFDFDTVEISETEYNMWKDSMAHPELYVVTAERISGGLKKYTITYK